MADNPKAHQRAAHQLPPGRHGLSRTFVEENQRRRILDAVADVVSLAGYSGMSVEEIVSAAGVSRRTFYDNFKDKEDAFLTAFDTISLELAQSVRAAYDASETFPEGVIACLRAFLEFVAAHPQYADACIVEVLAAGPAALERRNAVMRAFAELTLQGAETEPGSLHPPPLTAETIVGGIYEIVYARVLQGKTSDLPELLPDLAYSMMLPYLGHEAAEREAARAVAGYGVDSPDRSPTSASSPSSAGPSAAPPAPPVPGIA
jgi:AcrR family transcriptional regulator